VRTPETVLDGLAFPEGPRWRDGRLWFSDQHDRRVVAVDESGNAERIVEVPEQPSGLGWLPDGRMLVVSMLDRRVLRLENGDLVPHADLSAVAPAQCNDMVVDGHGRAYVGNFGFDMYAGERFAETNVVAVDPDGRVWEAASGLRFPNGTVVADGGRTLVVAESMGARLTAFSIGDDGTLSDRRVWAPLDASGIAPDGICLDAEGAIWVADAFGRRCVRVAQGGAVLDEVRADRGTFACALGGAAGTTLFVCAAGTHVPSECREQRSGAVLAVEVDVPAANPPSP
jgi:sugar lactone lactonase YvrE